jgi:hypothetical protein
VANSVISSATGRESDAVELLDRVPLHAVLGVVVAISLVGTHLLSRRADAAERAIERLDPELPTEDVFRGLDSSVGPIGLTLLLSVAAAISTFIAFTPILAALDTPMLFFVALPIAGFVWCYGVVLISVDRLGRRTLALDPFPEDRSLGLRSVGNLVFTGFAILSVAAVLYLVFLGHYLVDILIGLGVFAFGVVVFVLSLWRLHRQMASAKKTYVTEARGLYAQAYEPLRQRPDLVSLREQADLLSAAEAIEKRAEAIYEWPIDDGMLRWLAVIGTGVVTSLAVRVVFALLGF